MSALAARASSGGGAESRAVPGTGPKPAPASLMTLLSLCALVYRMEAMNWSARAWSHALAVPLIINMTVPPLP